MMLAYVDGRPIPSRSSSFTRLASLKRGGGSVKCWLGVICLTVTTSPSANGGVGGRSFRGFPPPGSGASGDSVGDPSNSTREPGGRDTQPPPSEAPLVGSDTAGVLCRG